MPLRLTVSSQRRLSCGPFSSAPEFEHFASLIENYAFSEAYEQLMAAASGFPSTIFLTQKIAQNSNATFVERLKHSLHRLLIPKRSGLS